MVYIMKFYKVTCPGCEKDFIANRSHREYCGTRCMMRVRRKKLKGLAVLESKSVPINISDQHELDFGPGVIKYEDMDQLRREKDGKKV